MNDNDVRQNFITFPYPLEMTGVSNSEYEDNISVLTRFPYPREVTGVSNLLMQMLKKIGKMGFRPLSR